MRTCKGKCISFDKQPPNYKYGRKCCRLCEIFVRTQEQYCECCGNPLAFKGRANQTQMERRRNKEILLEVVSTLTKSEKVKYEEFSLRIENLRRPTL